MKCRPTPQATGRPAAAATATLLATLLLGACATPQPPSPLLQEARAEVARAERDPQVQTQAPQALREATVALSQANALAQDGAAPEEIASAAYQARQRGRIAQTLGRALSLEAAIGGAEVERERARADARSADAQRAEQRTAIARTTTGLALMQTDAVMQQNRQLQASLAELKARPTERGLLITLHDVMFELDRAEVRPAALPDLRKLADFLKAAPSRSVLVEGHTDSSGTREHNLALSQRRADAVSLALTQFGVGRERLSTTGHGEAYPDNDNLSAGHRAMNRRVEIYIGDSEQPVPVRR